MAAILNSTILVSAILHKKTSLIHSDSTWWWQLSWNVPSWIQPFCTKLWLKLIHSYSTWGCQPSWILPSWIQPFCTEETSLIHSDSTWRWQPSWTLPWWIQDTAIFNSDTLLSSLRFTQKHSHSTLTLTQTNSILLKLIHSLLNLMMAAILISAIMNLAILYSAILVFSLKLTHTCQDWFPPFEQKNFTHSFWLRLNSTIIAAILNSAMLDSDTAILDSDSLLSSLRFTQKHFHSTLTLIQTNSIRLIWWWQPSWILPSWIQLFCTKNWFLHSYILTQLDDGGHLEMCHLRFSHFAQNSDSNQFTPTHSFSLNLMMSAILNSTILDSAILHRINFTHSFWLNLIIAAILNSAMLDSDTAIFNSDTLLSSLRFTQKHSHFTLTLTQTNSIWLKLIHSHLTWWWQPSWILPSWILPSWIQPS